MTETPADKLHRAIAGAFDKWSQRYYEKLFETLDKGTEGEKFDAYKQAWNEQSFLRLRTQSPGLFQHVAAEVKANPIFKRQRHTMLKACLTSILSPEELKIDSLTSKSDFGRPRTPAKPKEMEGYTRRQIQRLFNDVQREVFFEAGELAKKRDDDRFALYSSVFASYSLPKTSYSDEVAEYMAQRREEDLKDQASIERIFNTAALRFISPGYLEDLIAFKQECSSIMSADWATSEEAKLLARELQEYSPSLSVLRNHLDSMLTVTWFRHLGETAQRRLLEEEFKFRYDASDAHAAKGLIEKVFPPAEALDLLFWGAVTLFRIGQFENAIAVYKECLKFDQITPDNKAIIKDNIGYNLMVRGKPKLAIPYLQDALAGYEQAGKDYRCCVVLKNLAEAERALGFKSKATRLFAEANERGMKLNDENERFGVLWNLASAYARLKEIKLQRDYLMRILTDLPNLETEKVLRINRLLSEIGP